MLSTLINSNEIKIIPLIDHFTHNKKNLKQASFKFPKMKIHRFFFFYSFYKTRGLRFNFHLPDR